MRKLAEAYESSHHDFKGALEGDVISIIGEFKKASPSLGKIKSKINLLDRVEEYNASVDAISCSGIRLLCSGSLLFLSLTI